jgi:hypothetical protein
MSLNPFDPRLKAFQSQIFPGGIDLKRSVIGQDLGVFVADPAASFRPGQVVALNTSGNIVLCDGTGAAPDAVPFGIAKWQKALTQYATIVDEPIVLNGTTVTSLKHAGLVFGAVSVRSAPDMGGVLYVGGSTDYTLNTTNGTVARVALGAIADGATVYVTYTYALTEADLDFQGRNFFNFNDDVTIQQGRIAVATAWSIIFTTAYDPARTYSRMEQLYVDGGANAGLFTNNSAASRPAFGRVMQLPTAGDPFMGIVTPGHA